MAKALERSRASQRVAQVPMCVAAAGAPLPRLAIAWTRTWWSGPPLVPCVTYAAKSTEDIRGSIPDQLRDCAAAIDQAGDRLFVADTRTRLVRHFTGNRGPGLADAMQHAEALVAKYGAAPRHKDWVRAGRGRPCARSGAEHFGTFGAALDAAGVCLVAVRPANERRAKPAGRRRCERTTAPDMLRIEALSAAFR